MSWMPCEELLKKMWETLVDNGLGNLLKPFQMRRIAAVELEIMRCRELSIAQLQRDKDAVARGFKDVDQHGSLIKPTSVEPTSAPLSEGDLLLKEAINGFRADTLDQDTRRSINLLKTIEKAQEDAAQRNDAPSDKPVDPDWMTRWRNYAQDVSADELQQLWAKALNGEVSAPGSFSLFTLDLLRNLTTREASMISFIFPYVLCGYFMPHDLLKMRFAVEIFIDIQSIGIISGVDGFLYYSPETNVPDRFECHMLCDDKVLIIMHDNASIKIKERGYSLRVCPRTS